MAHTHILSTSHSVIDSSVYSMTWLSCLLCEGVGALSLLFILMKCGTMKDATRCVILAAMQKVCDVCVCDMFSWLHVSAKYSLWLWKSILSKFELVILWLLPLPDFTTVDITQHARQVVQIVELAASMDERLTPLKLVEAWMGKGPAKRRKMIQTTTLSRLQVKAVIVRLLLQNYLRWPIVFCLYSFC